jgi:predicted HD phosphohydrolase
MTQAQAQAPTFTRMDESSAEQWAVIGAETMQHQGRVAERVLAMLRSLADVTDGFAVDQLTHCLQAATRAERAGADDELVVASLCHDIGKAVSVPNHPAIAAEILKSYVRDEVYWMILVHQDFQGRHYYHHFGGDPNAREQYRGHPAFELAERFADEWDQTAFDPDYDTLPLEHFEERVRALFAKPQSL